MRGGKPLPVKNEFLLLALPKFSESHARSLKALYVQQSQHKNLGLHITLGRHETEASPVDYLRRLELKSQKLEAFPISLNPPEVVAPSEGHRSWYNTMSVNEGADHLSQLTQSLGLEKLKWPHLTLGSFPNNFECETAVTHSSKTVSVTECEINKISVFQVKNETLQPLIKLNLKGNHHA